MSLSPTLRITSLLAFGITAIAISQSLTAQDGNSQQTEREIRAVNCSVRYINKTDIPAKADGTLTELMFEEGDTVTKDQVLAMIDSTAAKLAVELKRAEEKEATLNALNDINLKDSINNEKVAKAEYESYKTLRKEGAIPFWEMEKKRLEAERQVLRIDLAKMEQKIALIKRIAKQTELEMAEFELTKRDVTSPVTGFIEKRIAQIGQWVQAGSPIATLIQMDRLRVEGDIDALRYPGVVEKGAVVEVTVFQGDRSVTVDGTIGYVSMEVDVRDLNNIWVEIENEKIGNDWKFKPGMKAEITIK
jgi:RND family efflux transporter MFP subunit